MRPRLTAVMLVVGVALAIATPAQGASGIFDRTWGKDVLTGGGTGSEICIAAASCQGGSAAGALGGELNSPEGIATDGEGNLYVVDRLHARIQKFDSSGNFLRTWGQDVVGGNAETGFEICTAAASCQSTGASGGLGGEFYDPKGVATDAAGNVYVADTSNNRIQKFDSSGNFLLTWGKNVDVFGGTGFEVCTIATRCQKGAAGGLGGELKFPAGAATDAAGNVYVTDTYNHRIQKFDSSGNFLLTWGKNVNIFGLNGFETCNAAAICQAGQVGGLGGEFNFPRGAAPDPAGNVYVADAYNHRIQKFTSSGNFLRAWGKNVDAGGLNGFEICTGAASCQAGATGGLGGELNYPSGVAIDAAGDLYIADSANNRIQKFDSAGALLRAWGNDVVAGNPETGFEICTAAASCRAGATGGLGGELNYPWGAATNAAGDLYVADLANNRIQKFSDAAPSMPEDPGGSTGGSTGSTGTGLQGTENPLCQVLRKKLKQARTKPAKKKIRGKLRRLGC